MVIAAASVMKEPRSGPMVRMASHQAAGVPPPRLAMRRTTASASDTRGRVAASAMTTTTKSASV